ncbi:hypothetical protein PHJA_001981000 [Phtheirospermum japonicum]|uniref:Integral membrane bound transporter domain-containing protein n=1 Tax=Phtheirospermum japonicum TaxID=374723 RepID=A0A830CVQ4_9LAMI|nr:hypothetical protein PHJA_001981000 [Phtheirospermum japonicum]
MSKSTAKDHARIIWHMRLRSALRTALACAIVGGATLYGPKFLVNQIKFASISYVTVVVILSNNAATLGHALSGCWHALHASIQVVPLAMLGRWLVAPGSGGGMSAGVAAVAAAAASFLVTMPESTHVTAKRIALGLIATICTEVVVSSDETRYGFMNPLHVGASAILGALASLLALLLPFPGLAHYKVKKLCQVYAENASERMDIYLKAFNAKDHQTKTELVFQAKPIAEIGTKLLQNIKTLQEGIPWERPWSRCTKNNSINVENRLQSFELPIRAMEYSLVNSSSVFQILDEDQLSNVSQRLSTQLQTKIEIIKRYSPSNSEKEDRKNLSDLQPLEPNLPIEQKYEPALFFFSCIDMLLNDNDEKKQIEHQKTKSSITQKCKSWILKLTNIKRLEPAIKYSVSLGLSLLLGLILERQNAVWASFTVAISFTMARQPLLTTTNTKAQGTAVGSVYGVICCFLFRKPDLRLLAIVPWIVFATFLKHSKMYGQTGGASAAIAALLILGRKNYGPTDEFAISRLVSVFIGLFCLVLVEVLLQPSRAATLAKRHLSLTLRCCYKKVVGCLYNVVSMLYVGMYNLEMLSELMDSGITVRKELEEQLNYEVEELQGTVNCILERVDLIKKSQEVTGDDRRGDLEAGKLCDPEKLSSLITEEVLSSGERDNEDEKQLRERMVCCLGAIGFCISSLRKEIDQIEICIKEIVR